ncbi:MlaA family lipoprotein [Azospirillum halopraeferens]|uniref:MlaA family lipoprotein n=1 Tax=Azospirillum halopraeferens TaxID=34010 RepID=UPI000422D7A6|nr:MlaA family lipoprotein [Azospirillum halopraeferens]
MGRTLVGVVFGGMMWLASGAATAQDADPLRGFNVWADDFNRVVGTFAVAPVMEAVRSLPPVGRSVAGNLHANLTEPVSALSWGLSGDAANAGRSLLRFTVNSTAGLLGAFDVADAMGVPRNKRYFSEGVCALGVPAGPYLVVPGVGPSTLTVTAAALTVMLGSTYALSFISLELALASVGLDLVASAAALESLAGSEAGPDLGDRERRLFMNYVERAGCPVE